MFLAFLLLGLVVVSVHGGWASAEASVDAVRGLWYTEDRDGGVEFYSCGDQICGRFYWLSNVPGEGPARDVNNPDPSKRDQSLCHMQFMGGFTPDGEGRYRDGWIYSPRHGAVFNASIELVDHDTLTLHGYMFVPLLGQSQTWRRAERMPSCAEGQATGNMGLKSRG